MDYAARLGIEEVVTAPRSPWQNPYAARGLTGCWARRGPAARRETWFQTKPMGIYRPTLQFCAAACLLHLRDCVDHWQTSLP